MDGCDRDTTWLIGMDVSEWCGVLAPLPISPSGSLLASFSQFYADMELTARCGQTSCALKHNTPTWMLVNDPNIR